jgi:hypothetical protein
VETGLGHGCGCEWERFGCAHCAVVQCARLEAEIRKITTDAALSAPPEGENPFMVPASRSGGRGGEPWRGSDVLPAPPLPPPPASGLGASPEAPRAQMRPPSPSRSRSPAREVTGERFLSPIYRSASPSRRVGADGVRISSFGRAPRFRDDKQWVPGPGKYESAVSDFAVRTVASQPDLTGLDGHTWQDVGAGPGGALAATAQYAPAMTTTTALVLSAPSPS